MKILYVAPDIPIPHIGTFLGGSTHVLSIATELAVKRNKVVILARRMSGQKGYEKLSEYVSIYRVYRGLLFPAWGGVSRKVEKYSIGIIPELKNKVGTNLKAAYLSAVYRPILMLISLGIMLLEDIDAVLERNSSRGIGVFPALALGIPTVSEVIDTDYNIAALQYSKRILAYTLNILPPNLHPKTEITTAGVDLNMFRAENDGAWVRKKYSLEDKKVAIYIGEMSAWHGADDLPAIAEHLDSDTRILIVGKNAEKLDGQNDKLVTAGFVPHHLIPEYIAASDVALAPYNPQGFEAMERHGFYFSPIKIFEYMACGKTIVTTDIKIVRDIIEENRCGILVEPGHPEEIAQTIRYILKNKEKAKEMGARGKETAKKYTWEKVAEQIDRCLKEAKNAGV